MGNSASSQGSSTGTHDGDVGSSISEEQHDWPIEQAADTPEIQSLQEMRKPYNDITANSELVNTIRILLSFSLRGTINLSEGIFFLQSRPKKATQCELCAVSKVAVLPAF